MNFKKITLRQRITSRGGGVEISLTSLGFKGHKMAAYQNYLGGGLLGRVCCNDTVRHSNNVHAEIKFSDPESVKKLDQIADQLKRYYHNLSNPVDCWESMSYDQNQNLSESAY